MTDNQFKYAVVILLTIILGVLLAGCTSAPEFAPLIQSEINLNVQDSANGNTVTPGKF